MVLHSTAWLLDTVTGTVSKEEAAGVPDCTHTPNIHIILVMVMVMAIAMEHSPFQVKPNHGKPSQVDMKMTPAIMMTFRKGRGIRNVLQVQGGS